MSVRVRIDWDAVNQAMDRWIARYEIASDRLFERLRRLGPAALLLLVVLVFGVYVLIDCAVYVSKF